MEVEIPHPLPQIHEHVCRNVLAHVPVVLAHDTSLSGVCTKVETTAHRIQWRVFSVFILPKTCRQRRPRLACTRPCKRDYWQYCASDLFLLMTIFKLPWVLYFSCGTAESLMARIALQVQLPPITFCFVRQGSPSPPVLVCCPTSSGRPLFFPSMFLLRFSYRHKSVQSAAFCSCKYGAAWSVSAGVRRMRVARCRLRLSAELPITCSGQPVL